jgi:hypothetical protein
MAIKVTKTIKFKPKNCFKFDILYFDFDQKVGLFAVQNAESK